MYFSWNLLLGGSNAGKWHDHGKKKFFINNSVEALRTSGSIETTCNWVRM